MKATQAPGPADPASLGELPAHAALQAPNKAGIITPEAVYTFEDLARTTLAAAGGLAKIGLSRGERVGILLPNCMEHLHAYFAVPAAGGVPVPINSFLAPPEVAGILRDSDAVGLVVTPRRLATLVPHAAALDGLRFIVLVDAEGGGPQAERIGKARIVRWRDLAAVGWGQSLPPPPAPNEVAALAYTSGTTGKIKGVMLTHANLISNARACLEAVKLRSNDKLLLFLPMFHSLTQTVCLVLPRLACLTVVLLPGVDRNVIQAALRRWRPTIFLAVPAVYTAMSDARPSALTRWLNPVRVYLSGAAPLPADVRSRFELAWHRPLCEGYGLSEAAPVVCLNPVDGRRKDGSVGPPLPGIEVRTLDPAGAALPAGEVGEIVVRGPNVMAGYHKRPEETAAALRDGWLYTGDVGRLDEDGYLYVVGRQKEMLIFRGMNIYPREVEEVLTGHPEVAEAAVIGLADPQRGEVPFAAVALKPGASASGRVLRDYCKSRLARYKVPRSVIVVPALPRNPTGKVQKSRVRDAILAARDGGSVNLPNEGAPDTSSGPTRRA